MKMTGVKGQVVKVHDKKWDVKIWRRWGTQKRLSQKTLVRLLKRTTDLVTHVVRIDVDSFCVMLCQVSCIGWVCGLWTGDLHIDCTYVLAIQWAVGSVLHVCDLSLSLRRSLQCICCVRLLFIAPSVDLLHVVCCQCHHSSVFAWFYGSVVLCVAWGLFVYLGYCCYVYSAPQCSNQGFPVW